MIFIYLVEWDKQPTVKQYVGSCLPQMGGGACLVDLGGMDTPAFFLVVPLRASLNLLVIFLQSY